MHSSRCTLLPRHLELLNTSPFTHAAPHVPSMLNTHPVASLSHIVCPLYLTIARSLCRALTFCCPSQVHTVCHLYTQERRPTSLRTQDRTGQDRTGTQAGREAKSQTDGHHASPLQKRRLPATTPVHPFLQGTESKAPSPHPPHQHHGKSTRSQDKLRRALRTRNTDILERETPDNLNT